MPHFICTACGTQYPESAEPPPQCVICEEERQYVPPRGQTWTTLAALAQGHFNSYREVEPGVIGIGSQPQFAIGQRALLVRTPGGNVLWDCISLLDAATVTLIKGLGGIQAIAISHPHFYTTMVEWAHTFECPIHLHAADKEWVMRPDAAVRHWEGETLTLWDGVTLVRCGGHFPGGTVLHWAGGAVGARHRLFRRYPHRDHRPQMAVVHAQLSEPDPALAPRGGAHRRRRLRRSRSRRSTAITSTASSRVTASEVLERSVARYVAAIEGTRGY